MSPRVNALLAALLLLWSCLSTLEAPRASARPASEPPHAVAVSTGPSAPHEGSVEHHHLDDLPSQAQIDPPADTAGLPPASLKPDTRSMGAAPPRSVAPTAARSPWLAGLLRPPREAAVTG